MIMKTNWNTNIIIFLFVAIGLLFANVSFAQELELRDGYYFKKDMLFTGIHTEHFENGKVKMEINFKNGLK